MIFRHRFLFLVILTIISCTKEDQPIIEEETSAPIDSWICGIESIIDDNRRYELGITEEGDYLTVGTDRIIQVSKDGMLKLELDDQFIEERREEDRVLKRIYNNKIFSFSSSRSGENYNPEQKVLLRIYSDTGELLESVELETFGVLQDVEVEDENNYGLLMAGGPQSRLMILMKFNKTEGFVKSIILNDTGSNPRNLHIGENGHYLCSDNSTIDNLYYLDNELNLIWKKRFNDIQIAEAELVAGKGIYITGSTLSFLDFNYIALISEEGDMVNKVEIPTSDDDANLLFAIDLKVNSNSIAIAEIEPSDGTRYRVTTFDFDLVETTSFGIDGNNGRSNIVNNEIGGFSFLYSIASDPNQADPVTDIHPRIYKLNDSFSLPSTYIKQ